MRVLISGASGLIGSALQPALRASGHDVVPLVRRQPGPGELQWNPSEPFDPANLKGIDAVIHLSGKKIAGRWTEQLKRELIRSRVETTRTLAVAVAQSYRATGQPGVLISASAIGYYGNRGDEILTEESGPGSGFAAELGQAWEQAASPAGDAGVRVVHPRIGIVLTKKGGALPMMLPAFRLGLGGPIGSGCQYMSVVSLNDLVGAFGFVLWTNSLNGPVNFVGPEPATNREFTRQLGQLLHRPTIFPLPAFMVRALFGQMGDELLLSSARVIPHKLLAAGYHFQHGSVQEALRAAVA